MSGGLCAGVGFHPAFRYDKYRTEFSRRARRGDKSRHGHVTLDETPMGVFMELEGSGPWIDRTAKELGFSRNDYITMSLRKVNVGTLARGARNAPVRYGFQSPSVTCTSGELGGGAAMVCGARQKSMYDV